VGRKTFFCRSMLKLFFRYSFSFPVFPTIYFVFFAYWKYLSFHFFRFSRLIFRFSRFSHFLDSIFSIFSQVFLGFLCFSFFSAFSIFFLIINFFEVLCFFCILTVHKALGYFHIFKESFQQLPIKYVTFCFYIFSVGIYGSEVFDTNQLTVLKKTAVM
jgi:hypothetical protein